MCVFCAAWQLKSWGVQRAFSKFAKAISCTIRTVGSKEPLQQNPLSWCQWGRIVRVIHSALEPHISLFLPPFRREANFLYAQTYCHCCVCVFFLISAIVCGWLVYFYWCALLLLIRDIFLTFQSGQKVPKTCLFTFGAVSLLLLLCRYVSWLLLFGEDHNSQSSSQSRNLVLEQNSLFFVFSLGFGVLGLFFFWGGTGTQHTFLCLRPFWLLFWLGRQRASSDYRANSGKASIPNCFNCKVSWKDSIHAKDAGWWSAYCRTQGVSAFVVTVRLQRAVYLFCLFPCFCAP